MGHQFLHRRADQRLVIARLLDVAGHRDDARDERLAALQGVPDRPGGGDVEALHAVVCAAHAVGHLDAGEHADQLLGAARRVARRHRHHLHVLAQPRHRGTHRLRRLGLVVLDADQHLLRLQHVAHDRPAAHDGFRLLAHQQVIAGNEGLAFRPVQHQRPGGRVLGGLELEVAGEHRAAQPHDAGIAQVVADLPRRGAAPGERFEIDPALLAVGLDHHRQRRKPRGVGHQAMLDRAHRARGRGMDGGREIAVGGTDALALEHALARLYHGSRRAADVLVQRHHQMAGKRRPCDRQARRFALAGIGLDAAVELEKGAQHGWGRRFRLLS